jgi:hypothetical protein
VLIEPLQRQFERAAGLKTTGTRIVAHGSFGAARGIKQVCPFGFEESKIGHKRIGLGQ